jgi:hypothetical protein
MARTYCDIDGRASTSMVRNKSVLFKEDISCGSIDVTRTACFLRNVAEAGYFITTSLRVATYSPACNRYIYIPLAKPLPSIVTS